jgi:hypothetical protein
MKRSRNGVVAKKKVPAVVVEVEETITITFSECAENHIGMEKLGLQRVHSGRFDQRASNFEAAGARCELLQPNDANADPVQAPAAILVVRQGVQTLLAQSKSEHTVDMLFGELKA